MIDLFRYALDNGVSIHLDLIPKSPNLMTIRMLKKHAQMNVQITFDKMHANDDEFLEYTLDKLLYELNKHIEISQGLSTGSLFAVYKDRNYKLCPKCNKLADYNSHFKEYFCRYCGTMFKDEEVGNANQ